MPTSIFVSRHLEASSSIKKIGKKYNLHLSDRSLLRFSSVDFEVPDTKWLFFYSKTGVKYFSNYCSLAHYKIGCYGPATASYCMTYAPVTFQCDADTQKGIQQIERCINNEDLTFVVGRQSLRSLQKALPSTSAHKEVIVYDQSKAVGIDLIRYDIAILTSPMNVESFFQNEGAATKYIAIGQTTGAALKKRKIDPIIANSPSEDGISESLDSTLKTYF